jgi:hypothetical protein
MATQTFREYLRDPPADSAARRAIDFGIDLTITHRNMFSRTMADRLRELDAHVASGRERRTPPRRIGPIPH